MLTKMPKILLVGSGLTSSVTAWLLQRHNTLNGQLELSIWDKAKGAGGRMSTSRSPGNSLCIADLGAQYISATPHYKKVHQKIYEELISQGILEKLKVNVNNMNVCEPGTEHFVASKGSGSIVKHFIGNSAIQPLFGHHVVEITQHNSKWLVKTTAGHEESFDHVVLTIPVPQILQLKGDIQQLLEKSPDTKRKLSEIEYSSRYALALFYNTSQAITLPHNVSYLTSDPVFRFVAVDNVKRNRPGDLPAVVFHTSVPFGIEHLEKSVEEMKPILLQAVRNTFPDLPSPDAVKCQKWRYSQVTKPCIDQPGCVQLSRDPLMIIGGDGFIHSNFDGCVSSAVQIVDAITKHCK